MQKEIETRAEILGINLWSTVGKDGEKYVEIEMEVETIYNYDEDKEIYNKAFWDLLNGA